MKATLLIAALSSVLLRAQPVSSPATPKFEVVSIRRHTAQSGPVQGGGPTPDGFRAIGLPMGGIFQWAYALPYQPGLLRGDQIEELRTGYVTNSTTWWRRLTRQTLPTGRSRG